MITLPKVSGIIFAYDARQGVTLEPLETQAIGKFEYATAGVEDISRNNAPLVRRSSGVDPYRAMQVPYSPRSGINGIAPYGSYPEAYAPAFDMLAEQQSTLQQMSFDSTDLGSVTLAVSLVVLAAMRSPSVDSARLLSWASEGETSGGSDDGLKGFYVSRDGVTDAIRFVRGGVDQLGAGVVSTPIALDTLYRIGAMCSEESMKLFLDNVEAATNLPYTRNTIGPKGKFSMGGQSNNFTGHNGVAWDGPILFAIGANVAWTEEERTVVDSWIVEEFNL